MPVQNLPFIENMEKRIQSASHLLDAILGHCFTNGLEHRDSNAIYNCLRAYAAIDNTRSAEEIFRTTIVAPLIQKIIPHERSAAATGSSTDALENDYQQIKQCVDKDCRFLLEISSTGIAIWNFLFYGTPNNFQSFILDIWVAMKNLLYSGATLELRFYRGNFHCLSLMFCGHLPKSPHTRVQ